MSCVPVRATVLHSRLHFLRLSTASLALHGVPKEIDRYSGVPKEIDGYRG